MNLRCWWGTSLHRSLFFGVVGQALVGEMKKGENAAGSVGHFFGARSGRLHSKSGTASKSRPFMKYLRVGR